MRRLLIGLLLLGAPAWAQADFEAQKKELGQLLRAGKLDEAQARLNSLSPAHPDDPELVTDTGLLRLLQSFGLRTPEARREARRQARALLVKACRLGVEDMTLDTMIDNLPIDGGPDPDHPHQATMDAAEAAFKRGDLPSAIAGYQQALAVDPKLYEAALYTGDCYFRMGDYDKGAAWYTRAIEINPDRESAWRYWGDLLVKQGKPEEARARFLEAVLTTPDSRLARIGLRQWAEASHLKLESPRIAIPASVSVITENNINLNLDPSALKDDDGSAAWLSYGLVRVAWRASKFAERHPNQPYRHTLDEEVDALGAAVQTARDLQPKIKAMDPSLANLMKISEAGLLAPYVLLSRSDEGIIQDYPAYRAAHRDLLLRYLNEFLITSQSASSHS